MNYNSDGSVINVFRANIIIENCYFANNMAINGGVISASNSQLEVSHSSFFNNTASDNGGSIYIIKSTQPSPIYAVDLYNELYNVEKWEIFNYDYQITNLLLLNLTFENNSINIYSDSHTGTLLNNMSSLGFCQLPPIANFTLMNSFVKKKGKIIYLKGKGYLKGQENMSKFHQCISESGNDNGTFVAFGKGWLSKNEFEKLIREFTLDVEKSLQENYSLEEVEMLPLNLILEFTDAELRKDKALFITGVLNVQDHFMPKMKYCSFKNNFAQWAASINNNDNSDIYCDANAFIDNNYLETAIPKNNEVNILLILSN